MSEEQKLSMLSIELEKAIIEVVDSRVKILIDKSNTQQYEKFLKVSEKLDSIMNLLNKSLDRTEIVELSNQVKKLDTRTQNIRIEISDDQIEQKISKILLDLVPGFFDKIAKEVRKHIASIALFALENSKEKE